MPFDYEMSLRKKTAKELREDLSNLDMQVDDLQNEQELILRELERRGLKPYV